MTHSAATASSAPAAGDAAAIRIAPRIQSMKPSSTLAISARVAAMKAGGRNVIGFGTGEPDFNTPEVLSDAAVSALRDGHTHYVAVPGPAPARAAIAAAMQRRLNLACGVDDIVITVGGKSAIYFTMLALIEPGRGDEVIVPTPAWVSYRPMIELAGGRVVEVAGSMDREFRVTPEDLEAAITDRTVAVCLNSPSNPCGTMYGPEELEAIAAVLRRHPHVSVVSDELYEQLVYGDVPHVAFATLPGMADRTVTINGLSKAYAMTGWRLGFIVATAPGVAKAIAKVQGQVTSHAASFTYAAVEAAMNGAADEDLAAMRDVFIRRGAMMHERLVAIDGVRCPRPTGAFYCFPDIRAFFGATTPAGRAIDSSLSFAEALLEEAEVAVVPGDAFGAAGEGHVRLSFACADELIAEGLDRIARWAGTLVRG
ncbi:MAG: pyridoxal phosphate-dependent aminotransferase [Phycisphaerales bacterium]